MIFEFQKQVNLFDKATNGTKFTDNSAKISLLEYYDDSL